MTEPTREATSWDSSGEPTREATPWDVPPTDTFVDESGTNQEPADAPQAEASQDWVQTQAETPVPPKSGSRGGGRGLLVAGIAVLIVALFGGAFVLVQTVNDRRVAFDATLQVGSCITLKADSAGNVTHQTANCSDSISYTIASVADGEKACPSNSYQSLSITSQNRIAKTACLIQNLEVNSCYSIDKSVDKLAKVACTDPKADFLVASRNDTVDDPKLCTEKQKYEGYATPPRTYCLASPVAS